MTVHNAPPSSVPAVFPLFIFDVDLPGVVGTPSAWVDTDGLFRVEVRDLSGRCHYGVAHQITGAISAAFEARRRGVDVVAR